MAKISIIIPCYNVEQYIDCCMNTVVNQTIGIENLEIILIDDASTDATRSKLLDWEARYPKQIFVVNCDKNLRQGGARNIGLRYATSKYIGFVDSDDWIELDMYKQLYEKAEEGNYTVVKGKFIRQRNENEAYTVVESEDQEYRFEEASGYYWGEITETGNNGSFGSICTGIYLRDIVIDNHIFFPERITYEDNYWSAMMRLYTDSMYIIDSILYHYRANPNSTTTTRNNLYHLERLDIEMMKLEKYVELGLLDLKEYHDKIAFEFIQLYYLNTIHILFARYDKTPDIINYLRKKVVELFPNWKQNPYIRDTQCSGYELIALLDLEGDLSEKEIEIIKQAYVNSIS